MARFLSMSLFLLNSLVWCWSDITTPSTNYHEDDNDDDFCSNGHIDAAYFNGYDTILIQGNKLWYYYRDQNNLSRAYDQRSFTQGDKIQGAFNISTTPSDCITHQPDDCNELKKLQSTAIYFLYSESRAKSYYNVDVRFKNGTQKRIRSRDLPWNMKQVGLLKGKFWPNGWETYQKHRPVSFLPSRYEVIFIINQELLANRSISNGPLLTWNTLNSSDWNKTWKSKVLTSHASIFFTGMFEMNGNVYAIGEKVLTDSSNRSEAAVFQYTLSSNHHHRDLIEMNKTVKEFFGCYSNNRFDRLEVKNFTSKHFQFTEMNEKTKQDKIKQPTTTGFESNSSQKLDSKTVFLLRSSPKTFNRSKIVLKHRHYPILSNHAYFAQSDSILLTVCISIVTVASIICIILACLAYYNQLSIITGCNHHQQCRYEESQSESRALDPSVVALDYQKRASSIASSLNPPLPPLPRQPSSLPPFALRYDSLNSLTAIYSRVAPKSIPKSSMLHSPKSNDFIYDDLMPTSLHRLNDQTADRSLFSSHSLPNSAVES